MHTVLFQPPGFFIPFDGIRNQLTAGTCFAQALNCCRVKCSITFFPSWYLRQASRAVVLIKMFSFRSPHPTLVEPPVLRPLLLNDPEAKPSLPEGLL